MYSGVVFGTFARLRTIISFQVDIFDYMLINLLLISFSTLRKTCFVFELISGFLSSRLEFCWPFRFYRVVDHLPPALPN